MKKILLVVLMMFTCASYVYAEYYRVSVSRQGSNVYKDHGSGAYIITKYCHEYAHRDDALLNYDKYSYSNWISFSSGTRCDVKEVR